MSASDDSSMATSNATVVHTVKPEDSHAGKKTRVAPETEEVTLAQTETDDTSKRSQSTVKTQAQALLERDAKGEKLSE